MKKFFAVLIAFLLAFSLASCSLTAPQKNAVSVTENPDPSDVVQELDIFVHGGKTYDSHGNPVTNYTVDADGNVLAADGSIVIAKANVRELTAPMAFERLTWDDLEVLNKDAEDLMITLIARTTVHEDGTFDAFRDEYTVRVFLDDPNADFKEVEFRSDEEAEAGDIYKFILDDKDETSVKLSPEDGSIPLTFVVTGPGEQTMILTNAFGEEICRIRLVVVLPAAPEPEAEELGSEQGADEGTEPEETPPEEVSVDQPSPTAPPAATPTPVVTLCTHNWEPVYEYVGHPATYETVHHDAVYEMQQVYVVDQPKITATEEMVTLTCARCGQSYAQYEHGGLSYSQANAAILAHCLECDSNYFVGVGTHTYTVQEEVGHYEQQQVCVQAAYDEEVMTHAAWGEDVLTGYRCTICGARKAA